MNTARLLQLVAGLVPHVPAHLGYVACDLLGALVGPQLPAYQHIQANLRATMPHAADHARAAAARRAMIGLFKNYFDLFRLHTLSAADRAQQVVVVGIEHLHHASTQGRGVLIVAPHCGPYTIGFAPLIQHFEQRLLVVVEQLADPRIHQIMNQMRALPQIDIEPLSPTIGRTILRALRHNQFVLLGGDRALAANALEVDFFGRQTPIPNGPAALALRTGAPLVPAYMQRLPNNRIAVHIDPPLQFTRSGSWEHDIRDATQKIAYSMQAYICRDPAQWLVAEAVWPNS